MEQFLHHTKVKFQKYYNPEHEHPTVQSIIYNTSRGVRFFNDENELLAFAINALYHLETYFYVIKTSLQGQSLIKLILKYQFSPFSTVPT